MTRELQKGPGHTLRTDARPPPDDGNGRPIVPDEEFQLLVASIKDYAIFIVDPTGRIITWNAGAERIKGYRPEEAVGKHMSIFYTREDLAGRKPERLLAAAIAEGRVEDEGWRVRKDGSRFWADVVITALRDSVGRLRGFAKVTRDLTSRREVEDKLRQSEERLAATLLSIGDGVLATDERACITLINPVAERLMGWSDKEALGRSVDDVFNIINEETRAKAPNPIARVLEEGVVIGLANHTALISRDGKERPIADSGAPIRDLQGVTRGAVLVFRDVTEERRAEKAVRESEEKLRLMIASVRDYAIFTLDTNGGIASWSHGAEQIMGYRENEIIGTEFSRFFTPEEIARGEPARELQLAAEQGRFEDDAWRIRKDGSRFWANVIINAVRDGQLLGFATITRDLTERRRIEDERLRLAHAEEAIRLRDEFLSIASHELKTPLTALNLQLQGIGERVAPIDEKLAKRVERATRASQRLADLIEALLDVSRIATGKLALHVESFDLVQTARDAVERIHDAATKAGCDLSILTDGAIWGRWDRLRVEQILNNLLSNAIKYAAGTPIDVSVGWEGQLAVLEIRDRGPGILESDLSRIFERFERAAAASYGGMGLGLYITRQIVEAHGGSVTASNADGGGALFTVRLPLVRD